MKKDKNLKIGRIDVDEKTAEPTLVEVDIDKIPLETDEKQNLNSEKPVGETLPAEKKSIGKQLSMQNLFIPDSDKEIDKRQKRLKRILYVSFIVIILVAVAFTAYRDFGSGKELAPIKDIFNTLLINWFYLPCALLALFFSYFFKGFKLSFFARHLTGKWHLGT